MLPFRDIQLKRRFIFQDFIDYQTSFLESMSSEGNIFSR